MKKKKRTKTRATTKDNARTKKRKKKTETTNDDYYNIEQEIHKKTKIDCYLNLFCMMTTTIHMYSHMSIKISRL
jgi:hypothetical protein